MKIQKWVILITLFLIINTYYDGKFTKMFENKKKYYTMALYAFIGLSIYMFIKKHPNESKNMLVHANSLVRYMPIDKGSREILSPLMDLTNIREQFSSFTPNNNTTIQGNTTGGFSQQYSSITPQQKRMLQSGGNGSSKRCVSEAKKKYVAASQQWKCAMCSNILDATYEVDHKVDLQYGGTNHVSNLAALCPNCHRKKTMKSHL